MIDGLATGLAVVTAVGCGLMAGLLFAFSAVIMPSLRRRPEAEGMATMQTINVVIVNPLFLLVFLGTAAGALALVGSVLRSSDRTAHLDLIGSGALYLIGTMVVAAAANVPRNDALDALDPTDPASADAWRRYLRGWTAWNHVRTTSCVAALALLLVALARG